MYSTLAVAGFAATALANAIPQGVTQTIAPQQPAPAGCSMSYPQSFQITTINATTSAHTKAKRADDSQLILTLNNGVLKSQLGDTGYIASNYQFQFDNPPQTGAIYTAGFSVCGNGSLALGGSAIFYSCNSGGFNNLYDRNWAPQCSPIYINTLPGGFASASGGSGASQTADGQPQASTMAGVTQISDNQPQATTKAGVTQISDNQPQAATSAPKVTQISDNQPQAATSAASSAPKVTQISDNQPQAATSAPKVTQISDNQPQAATSAPKVATPVSQISDNQPQAATMASPSPAAYTGAAVANGMSNFALGAAAVLGVAML